MTAQAMLQRLLLPLIAAAMVLLLMLCAVLALGAVLGAMGDATGSSVLHWVAAGLGIVLVADLVSLLLVLALRAALSEEEPPEQP